MKKGVKEAVTTKPCFSQNVKYVVTAFYFGRYSVKTHYYTILIVSLLQVTFLHVVCPNGWKTFEVPQVCLFHSINVISIHKYLPLFLALVKNGIVQIE